METKRRESLIKQAKQKYGTVTNISDYLLEGRVHDLDYDFDDFHYEEFLDTLYSHPEGEGGLVVYEKGTWAQVKEAVIKEQPSPTFKVTRQALAEILPHVCSDYKDRINKLAQKYLFSNEIEVSESIVRQAHKDATKKEQKEWLDKYLPLPKKKKIELVKYLSPNGESTVKWNIGVDSTYEIDLVLSKEVSSLQYDVMKVKLSEAESWDIFLGYFNDGITED